jgi:hypothetical protein
LDQRELNSDFEEAMRVAFSGMMRNVWTAMPITATEDSADGHTGTFQVTIKRAVQNLSTGEITYVDHPVTVDVPVNHPGGGKVASTYPTKKGDEAVGIVASRNIDGWHQNGQTQPPVDNRMHHLGDMMHARGYRSDPNKLQQVATDSVQHRSVDKKTVAEVHPDNGVTHRAVDPSTPAASESYDPYTQATKYHDHTTHGSDGVKGRAVDGDTEHSHGVNYDSGAWMSADNGKHKVAADPNEGVSVKSSKMVDISSDGPLNLSAPPGMLNLGIGSILAAALSAGAAADNVGDLGGDLSGQLPDPQVVGISHVNVQNLVVATSDAAAAAANVPLYGVYLNTAVANGFTVLCARMK